MSLINEHWMSDLERFAKTLALRDIYIIADQGVLSNPLLDGIKRLSPPVQWFSLFQGQPEEQLLEVAPLMMRLEFACWQHRQWLQDLITAFDQTSGLMIFISPINFEVLASIMRNLADGAWEDRSGLVRFYDTRIFPVLVDKILTQQQKSWLLDSVYLWSYQDRDGKIRWLEGTFSLDITLAPENIKINFSDEQMMKLDIAIDAQQYTLSVNFDELFSSKEEKFNTLWDLGWQAYQEDYSGNLLSYYQQQLAQAGFVE
ncbi:DUF4123 domain-containing protein [Atlantibacter hermannii]|uniref:DUF4123 domain-containing protein n=1 Tax=Atlantibacter hermannii TaxID=565 RepID=UPI001933B53E|nr:DUF4123 domain-containing protein [Atlantibacter hermannii]MBL7634239.1 DUF4123 domain-containing protein [Atlantibacter hermannii]MBL7674696.1 DUF4123 domain-containing protein [Atlantibacter hermannii]